MILAIIATGALGVSVGISNHADQEGHHDTWPAKHACKDKEGGDMCEYAPRNISKFNYLFTYTHDEHLKHSINEVLEKRGFAMKDYFFMLMIESRTGKWLDVSFLRLNDIFDGQVSPNDFPVKVYLREMWKGECSEKGVCLGVRGTLAKACEDGQGEGSKCTTASLQLLKKKLGKVLPYSFGGKCEKASEHVNWCKLSTVKELQIEACLGQNAGRACSYTVKGSGYENYLKGHCTGANKGKVLYCSGVPAGPIDAC